MADKPAPKASTLNNSSGGVFGVLQLPSSAAIPRGATVASSAVAQEHEHSDEEVESPQPKRVKKVTFREKCKAKLFDNHTPTSTTPTSSTIPKVEMTEVRARAARHKGQMNFEAERTSTVHSLTPYILLMFTSNSSPLCLR